MVKKRLQKKDFYLRVLAELKIDTNLTRIKKVLNLKKQNLNYYLAKLCKLGFIERKGEGWYEVKETGKKATVYGSKKVKDSVRGHAYIWNVPIEKIPSKWEDRINVLKNAKINFKLVGAMKNVPRIKVLGRKVWLCNEHIRIYDKEKASYYGKDAKESKMLGKLEAFRIVRALENKLGLRLNPNKISFQKEHYALIKNDLAKHHNHKGIILRVSDEEGEWLLIDDSLEEGGELETVGKKAFVTNPKVQGWWNDQKKHNFEVTPSFLLENINNLANSQKSQTERMDELMLVTKALVQEIEKLKNS